MDALRIEAAELRGRSFRCLPGCGFCCLCQPGLSPDEAARFSGPLAKAVAPSKDALRIVGQAGPCTLLAADRSCTQYALRPRGCRSFPFHTTMSWRTQVNLNRGCPGTWVEGPEATAGFDPAEALPPGAEAVDAARAGREAWAGFRRRAERAGVYEDPEAVRRRLVGVLPLLQDASGLAAGLAVAEAGTPVTAAGVRAALRGASPGDLHRFLEDQARATFGQRDAKRLPMFVDAEAGFAWYAFRLRGDGVERCRITPRGGLAPEGVAPLAPLLPERDPAASGLFQEHAGVLADRDLLYALAAFMMDRLGYDEPFANAALRELCAALGDLWLRAGLLARLEGRAAIGAREMARGVAFFDMDFLNAPSMGVAF